MFYKKYYVCKSKKNWKIKDFEILGHFWKRRAPENDKDPPENVENLGYGTNIFLKTWNDCLGISTT